MIKGLSVSTAKQINDSDNCSAIDSANINSVSSTSSGKTSKLEKYGNYFYLGRGMIVNVVI